MAIIHDEGELDDYLLGVLPSLVPADVKARYPNDKTGQINTVLGKNPLLFDRYLSDAIEIDVDALCDGKDVVRRRRSWSISRRPASIPATAPARCRRARCRPRRSPGSRTRRASSRWRSTSAA